MDNKPVKPEPQKTSTSPPKSYLPPGVASQVLAAQTTQVTHHRGPIPDPDTLKKYNETLPGAADRIFAMAEKDQNHNQALQTRLVNGQLKATRLGQWFALVIALAGIGCGTWLIYSGKSTEGLTSMFGPLAAFAGVYLYERRRITPKAQPDKNAGPPTHS